MKIKTINPFSEKVIASYPLTPKEKIEKILIRLKKGYQRYKNTSFKQRKTFLIKIGRELLKNKERCSHLITREMGKPIKQAEAEIEKCSSLCFWYAQNMEDILQDVNIPSLARKSYITYQPLGVIFAIMPWNFPFWQVFRFLIPNLCLGNVALLKHAPNTTGCAFLIKEIIEKKSLLKNVFDIVVVENKLVSFIIGHHFVQGVSFTGSVETGRIIAQEAGKNLKKSLLELGGSDPYLFLDDFKIEEKVSLAVRSRLQNSGQSCIAAKRFIVLKRFKKKFEELVVEEMRNKKCADPFLEDTDIGPLARFDLREKLTFQVKKTLQKGGKLLLGGKIPKRKGYFYPPTVITDIPEDTPAYSEELFGPVAAIIPVKNEKEAITIANNTSFGLGAGIFSQNLKKAEAIARSEIEAGNCFINNFVRTSAEFPFGGIKNSGYGRELGKSGVYEFANIKVIKIF